MYKLRFKLYDTDVRKSDSVFLVVNYYLIMLLDQNDQYIDCFYLDDWVGNNGACTRNYFIINPEHLLYTGLKEQAHIIGEIDRNYQYLKFHYNISSWKRKFKIAAALNSKINRI
jgi:hypothetical protein